MTADEIVRLVLDELDGLLVEHQIGDAGSIVIGSTEWRAGVRASRQLVELVAREHEVIR